MKRKLPLHFLFIPLLLGWLVLSSPQTSAIARQDDSLARQTAGSGTLCIVDVPDTTAFPVVSLNIKILDGDLQPGINLTNNDLRFYENNKTEIRPLPGADIRPLSRLSGISYYILADTGNRTDQGIVKSILQNFSSYYINQTDKLKIFTNPANQPYLYYSSEGGTTLSQAISDFPTDKDSKIRQVTSTLFKILDEIELAPMDCSKTKVLILIVGDEALPEKDFSRIKERLQALPVKFILFHVPNIKTNELKNQALYSSFAQQVKGSYHRILLGDDVRLFVSPALEPMIDYRQIYAVSYRSNVGLSGLRQITAAYKGSPMEAQGFASYSVQLQPGLVSWTGDKTITMRDGVQAAEKFQINVSWPDGYPRELGPNALLHVMDENGKEDVVSLPLEKVESHYQIEWSFGGRMTDSTNTFTIQAEVFDEFGESMRTPKNVLTVNVLAATPTPMLSNGGISAITPWWVYALVGGIAFVFLAILILFLVLWKKLGDISLNGVQNLAGMAKQGLQNIQKTIVGGGKNRKPVAVLRIMDGPKKLIGQDLKVTTEHITVGRDPQRTNYTFYDLETSTSVSGVHAIIERVNGNWRIVAVSESKSETFVNGEAIDFQQPVPLQSGDIVRLGYLAQQPVEFQFVTDLAGSSKVAANHIPTQSRSSNPTDPDATLTFDPVQEPGPNGADEKTAVFQPEEKTHISITPEEKKKIKPDTDSVDDYISKLRGE